MHHYIKCSCQQSYYTLINSRASKRGDNCSYIYIYTHSGFLITPETHASFIMQPPPATLCCYSECYVLGDAGGGGGGFAPIAYLPFECTQIHNTFHVHIFFHIEEKFCGTFSSVYDDFFPTVYEMDLNLFLEAIKQKETINMQRISFFFKNVQQL